MTSNFKGMYLYGPVMSRACTYTDQ